MVLAAEGNQDTRLHAANSGNAPDRNRALRGVGAIGALVLMAIAANCFLKYVWWTACYSAWSGIPKLAEQWRRAGVRASFFGWSVILLELASLVIVFSLIRLRSVVLLRNLFRVILSLILTVAGTGLLALALTWIKQTGQ